MTKVECPAVEKLRVDLTQSFDGRFQRVQAKILGQILSASCTFLQRMIHFLLRNDSIALTLSSGCLPDCTAASKLRAISTTYGTKRRNLRFG